MQSIYHFVPLVSVFRQCDLHVYYFTMFVYFCGYCAVAKVNKVSVIQLESK